MNESRNFATTRTLLALAYLMPLAAMRHLAAEPPAAVAEPKPAKPSAKSLDFPPELVEFSPYRGNPLFSPGPPGAWDAAIRERGWIMREGDEYRLWYTGYDGTPAGQKMLGHATSRDGLTWTRHPGNPIYRAHWVEDMMVVRDGDTYYMFAEGRGDQAHLLTSPDGLKWTRVGRLDIRRVDGEPILPGPYGTPTAWREGDTWRLMYERSDLGVWLAESRDLKIWTNVRDEPVLRPGPAEYDRAAIAVNQVVRRDGRYYAYYHGSDKAKSPRHWTTNIAASDDLLTWTKYPGNPLVEGNESSGIIVPDGDRFRLYTMHDQVRVHLPWAKERKNGPAQ